MYGSDWLEENADAFYFDRNTKAFPSQLFSVSLSVMYALWLAGPGLQVWDTGN